VADPKTTREGQNPMGVIAFKGSPRKEWKTATLLKRVLEGADGEKQPALELKDKRGGGTSGNAGRHLKRAAVKDVDLGGWSYH
jgi:multimeric flavodoxin WrbA